MFAANSFKSNTEDINSLYLEILYWSFMFGGINAELMREQNFDSVSAAAASLFAQNALQTSVDSMLGHTAIPQRARASGV